MKINDKIKKIIKCLVIILVIIPVSLIVLFNFPPINYLISRLSSNILTSKLGTEVSLDHIYLNPFTKSVSLHELFVQDSQDDTLLYVHFLDADLDKFNLDTNSFKISELALSDITVKLKKDPSGNLNYSFLLSDEPDSLSQDTVKPKFSVSVKVLDFNNINFVYALEKDSLQPFAMNFGNMDLRNLNLFATDFYIDNELDIRVKLDEFSVNEKCGLRVEKLKSKVDISQSGILLNDFQLKTSISEICTDKLNLLYENFDSFSDFLNNVKIQSVIKEGSILGLDDIGHFVPDIYGYSISPKLTADIDGTVSNLKINNLKIQYGDSTKIFARAHLKGLPDMEKFSYKLDTLVVLANSKDIMTLHQPLDTFPLVELPEFLDDFGVIKLAANSKGSLNKLKMNAILKSKLGNISTDLNLKSKNNNTEIYGIIDAGNLDLGSISGDHETLGKLSARIDTIGVSILKSGKIDGMIHGTVDSVGLMNYYYHNIRLDGNFSETFFNGQVAIKDPCLDLDFLGKVDFTDQMLCDFELDLNKSDLNKTNILHDSLDNLKFSIIANFSGNSLDNFNGVVILSEPLVFNRDSKTLKMNNFTVRSYIDNYRNNFPNRNFKINSNFFDAQISGRVRTEQLVMIFSKLSYLIFPSLDYESEKVVKKRERTRYTFDNEELFRNYDNKFTCEIVLNDTRKLTDFFMPELYISPNTQLFCDFNVMRAFSKINFSSDQIMYGDYVADSVMLAGSARHDTLRFGLDMSFLSLLGDTLMKPHFGLQAQHDTATWKLGWNNSDSYNGNIAGNFIVIPNEIPQKFPYLKLGFNQSKFNFMDSEFKISPSSILVDSTAIDFQDFKLAIVSPLLNSEKYDFSVNGKISENPNDKLDIEVADFDIHILENFVPGITFNGRWDGKYSISQVYNSDKGLFPLIEAHTEAKKLNINGVDLKNLRADIQLREGDSLVSINMFTNNRKNDSIKTISAVGTYDMNSNSVDLTLDINELSLNYFKSFFENYLQTSKYSLLTGHARVIGKVDDPLVNAALTLHGGYFKISYLGTQYDINDSMAITLDNKMIKLSKTKFYSGKGTGVAYLDGTLTHRNFKNFNMDVNLLCKNFMVLNAKETDSSAFWGKAFTSGNIKITGDPLRMIDINARVKTDKNTQVFLPLYMASEVQTDWNFITFKNPNQNLEIHRQQADLSDIRMNFNLEVTPDAEVQVIMDETTGNILRASANGDLRLNVSGSGDFNMYGALEIVNGDYLFTMQHVVSKKFEIERGGFLRWNGDPMDAIVDLSASYRLRKVNLFNLMCDESYRNKKVPVRCRLNMKGDLMTPNVSFGIKVEESSDIVQGQLDNLDEGNINKQAMSLLLLNQFQPLPGLKSSENSMFSDINPGELVSNQLNHWLSDISDKVDVGVNYQMGDGATSNEFDLAVSTQLLDDRVTVSTNLGVGGNSNNQTQRANNVIGEVEVDVKLNKSGGIQLKFYNKENDDELDQAPYIQGVGVIFKREFNRLRIFGRKRKSASEKNN